MSRLRTHNRRAARRQMRAVSWLWFTGRRTPKATFATATWPSFDRYREQRQALGLGSARIFFASSDGAYLKDDFGDRRFFPIPDLKAPQ